MILYDRILSNLENKTTGIYNTMYRTLIFEVNISESLVINYLLIIINISLCFNLSFFLY